MIFNNLKGYDSHSVINEIRNLVEKVHVIPNGLKKYMAFTINKDLIFIDSMQFMNCSLGKLLIKFSYHDFEYLAQEFDSEKLMRKDDYPDE